MKSTQKILIAGLILMVVLNICTLGFILFKHNHGFGHGMGGRQGHGKLLGKRLGFTPEQEAALEKLRPAHEAAMASFRGRMDSLRRAHVAVIKAEPFDSEKAALLAEEIGKCHTEMEKHMAVHFLEIKALCTNEQLGAFNQFLDRMTEHRGRHGMGGNRHGSGAGF